jgi:predicted nucleic acid-binding protein
MVAALCSWHEHHEAAAAAVNRRLVNGDTLIVAGPALIETYAVLTRLPPPHRLAAADALTVIDGSFIKRRQIGALSGRAYRTLLRAAPPAGVAGRHIYDVVIGTCGLNLKIHTLLTFNPKHFSWLSDLGVEIVVPQS